MLDTVINDPKLSRYLTSFHGGDHIVVEGDDSQDLYILASGELDILKGNKKIYEMNEQGSIFGEMSFLLGAKRTATVKAKNDAKAFRIPKEEVTSFLHEFPDAAGEIAKLLAKRLGEATQVLHGLKEFCDQLPDAVLLTDREGKIYSWNTAAKNLYGGNWEDLNGQSVEDLYEEPSQYREFLEEVKARHSVREKVLKIKHPEKGRRYISTSTTLLYDGHHNFKGVLSLGRDVTAVQSLERRYRAIRNWLVPSFLLLAITSSTIFFGYPHFSEGFQTTDVKKLELRNQLARDYVLLKSLLTNHFAAGDRSKTGELMKEYFEIQDTSAVPYTGLVLLDEDKKVFMGYSRTSPEQHMVGSSYAGIAFRGNSESIHKVLSLYRVDKEHPMGSKGVEVAFELDFGRRHLGWLVFQMDTEQMEKLYGLDETSLEKFQFQEPS